jgi:peroxiredoxin
MMFRKTGFVFFVCALIALALGKVQAAPALFTDFENTPRQLEEFTGKGEWTIVMIWASDCHFCEKEIGSYVEFNNGEKKVKARVMGISLDGAEGKPEAQTFIDKYKVDFPNLLGEYERVERWYEYKTGQNWKGTPTVLIYTPDGQLRAQQAGAVPVKMIEKFILRESKITTSKLESVQ